VCLIGSNLLFSRDEDPVNQFVLHKSNSKNKDLSGSSNALIETGDWEDEESSVGTRSFQKGLKAVEDRLINPLINNK
jgi:hypothetical protein